MYKAAPRVMHPGKGVVVPLESTIARCGWIPSCTNSSATPTLQATYRSAIAARRLLGLFGTTDGRRKERRTNPKIRPGMLRSIMYAMCWEKISWLFPSLVCSEEEQGEFEAEYAAEGLRAYYPTAAVKGIAVRLCTGAQEDQGPGGSEPDRASFRLRNGEMADEKGVDSTRRRIGR